MHLHEYQAKELLLKEAIPIPRFEVASNMEEVKHAINILDISEGIVKAQVHAGGRSKAKMVKIALTPEKLVDAALDILNKKIINNQTGPGGLICTKVLLSKLIDIKKEYYVALSLDRDLECPVIIASKAGGVDIETTAKNHPKAIVRIACNLNGTLLPHQRVKLVKFMGWEDSLAIAGAAIIEALAKAFIKYDAELLEINPLVVSMKNNFWALDAKMSIDSNALFRHQALAKSYDFSQLSKREYQAHKSGLKYIDLAGDIGCIVNGAGLALSIMDLLESHDQRVANFLDVGGIPSKEKIEASLQILSNIPKVKVIFLSIFGGIVTCDVLAQIIIDATESVNIAVPMVVRIGGLHIEKGWRILKQSSLNLIVAKNLDDAIQKTMDAK